ncbi:unnamed protein product [Triticum turgidum subsp. durum]|uniref:Cytochrome P450 n=1 Tax=Triticum turgidum subsp. durum TaxID=4567 RepID=A0A9R0VF42_TRITD|nr:unnamed protein product [Triticum turgidum subsp. durum]
MPLMAAFAKMAVECLQDPLVWLFLVSVALATLRRRRRRGYAPFPPGPKPLPIVGNMTLVNQLTHRGLVALAEKYGGLLHLRLGCLHVVAVSTPEHAREVLQARDGAFSNRPATAANVYLTYGRSDLAFADGGAHVREMRRLCATTLFSRRRAETWLAVRDGYGALARDVGRRSGQAVNLGELIFNHTVGVIFRAAFSAGDEGLDEFVVILRVFSKILGEFHAGDYFPWLRWTARLGFNRRLHAARSAVDKFTDKIIDDHVRRGKNPADADADLVDGLLAFLADANLSKGKDALHFTRDNVKAMIMQELADVVGLDRMVDDSDLDKLPFLGCIVKETFRMHPPIPTLLHAAAKNCVLGGYSVPKGSRIIINMWAINRYPEAWKDGDAFRPTRFMPGEGDAVGQDLKGGSFEFLPFGSGRRSCPAQGFGHHAVQLAVAYLAHGFNWELPDGMSPAELDMGDMPGITGPRAAHLYAVPTSRLNCTL